MHNHDGTTLGVTLNPEKAVRVEGIFTPVDNTYPTDLNLLNSGHETTEAMVDSMHASLRSKGKTPRTYRGCARKDYLAVAKKRKAKANEKRRAIRKQPGYLDRNLKSIQTLEDKGCLPLLSKKQQEELKTIRTLYAQQGYIFSKTHQVPDRIVSIHQPHMAPPRLCATGFTRTIKTVPNIVPVPFRARAEHDPMPAPKLEPSR